MALTRKDTLSTLSHGLLRSRYIVRELIGQVALILVVAFFTVGYAVYHWYQNIPPIDLPYLWWYAKAYLWDPVLLLPDHAVALNLNGQITQWSAHQILEHPKLNHLVEMYQSQLYATLRSATPYGIAIWLMMAIGLWRLGQQQRDNQLLEGVQQIPLKTYHRYLKKHQLYPTQNPPLKLGNACLPQNVEKQHLLIMGDTGTGKSQLLIQLLNTIRERGEMAIIYDPKGDMVRDFYRPEQDILYSPFDQRSPRWHIWEDLKTEQALETFAQAVIKENPNQDTFWSNTARMVLVAGLKKGRQEGLSFVETLQILLTSELEDLKTWLEGTEVSSDFANTRTAATILSELKSQVKHLKYIAESQPNKQNPKEAFSVTRFLANCFAQMDTNETKGLTKWLTRLPLLNCFSKKRPQNPLPWLFLPVQKQFKASARPIMAAQVELIANYILSQPTSHQRKIWLIMDELPSLGKLQALPELLAEGRGYGVAGVLATQNFSQLLKHFGKEDAHNLAGQCSNLIALRSSDPQTTEFLAKRFGKQIRKELQTNQSLSKGKAGAFSQGHTEHIAERAAISETELATLPNLQAFLKVSGVPNPVKIDIEITPMPPLNPLHCPIQEAALAGQETGATQPTLTTWEI